MVGEDDGVRRRACSQDDRDTVSDRNQELAKASIDKQTR